MPYVLETTFRKILRNKKLIAGAKLEGGRREWRSTLPFFGNWKKVP